MAIPTGSLRLTATPLIPNVARLTGTTPERALMTHRGNRPISLCSYINIVVIQLPDTEQREGETLHHLGFYTGYSDPDFTSVKVPTHCPRQKLIVVRENFGQSKSVTSTNSFGTKHSLHQTSDNLGPNRPPHNVTAAMTHVYKSTLSTTFSDPDYSGQCYIVSSISLFSVKKKHKPKRWRQTKKDICGIIDFAGLVKTCVCLFSKHDSRMDGGYKLIMCLFLYAI